LGPTKVARAAGTGASVPVECCQVCGHAPLDVVLSLGYMPPVNQMVPIGQVPHQQPWFPTNLLHCSKCELVQLGLAVDPAIIFPPEYPYTSGTTKLLRDNFADLHREAAAMVGLGAKDLVVDIGSNDGTLLSNFRNGGCRVLGIEPTDVGDIAISRAIPTIKRYFGAEVAGEVKEKYGAARIVTATNCFAHIEDVHAIVDGIVEMLAPDGAFISESHYLIGLLDTLQYDTIYHEHLRYYSVTSLKHLLELHDLEIFHARPIPSHGGSIRVYAARHGVHTVQESVCRMLASHKQAPHRLPPRRGPVQAAADVYAARTERNRSAHRGHQRAVTRQHDRKLCRARRRHHRLCVRDRRLAEDRQIHAGYADPGGGGIQAVCRSARMCGDLLLAHR